MVNVIALHSLLVLTPVFPYPTRSGGDIRLFELLRRLASRFDLHLLSYEAGEGSEADEFIRRSGVKSLTFVPGGQLPRTASHWRRRLDPWREAPHGLRLDVDPAFARELEERLAKLRPDAVLIEHIYLTQYRRFVGDRPVFVSCHNVETTKMERWFADSPASLPARWRRRWQIAAMRRCESGLARWVHTVFTTSEVDEQELRRMNGGGRFCCVPNGADLQTFTPRAAESFDGPPAAFFVGSLFYKPNLEAATLLKDEIWPVVRRELPDAVCHIAGNPGGLDLQALNDPRTGVVFHGMVPDIRPLLTASQMLVAPLRVGSGTRIKILEAMATGTPVVSTRIGAEGIHCTDHENILLADDPEEIAHAVVRLLRNRAEADRIGRAGRALVEAHYNWDTSAEIMKKAMEAAILPG